MSWVLSASGKLGAEVEHLEQEFVDELHALLAKFGMRFAQFHGPTIDRLTAGDAPAASTAPAPAEAATAEAAAPADSAAADPAPADAKGAKAASKATTG